MDFDFEEINPVACVLAIICGLFGVLICGAMMPGNLLMNIVVFCACTFMGYIVSSKIAEN